MERKKLATLGLEVSNRCNMVGICRHCNGAPGMKGRGIKYIPDSIIKMVTNEAPDLFCAVCYSGGEIATYADRIRQMASSIHLPYSFMTNGLEVIDGTNPTSVLLSVDSDDIRPGVEHKVIFDNALRYQSNASVSTALSRNLDIQQVYREMCDMNVRLKSSGHELSDWRLGFILPEGFASKNLSIFPSWNDIFERLASFLKVFFQEWPFHLAIKGIINTANLADLIAQGDGVYELNYESNPCRDCRLRQIYPVINVDGEFQFCPYVRSHAIPIKGSLHATMDWMEKSKDSFLNKYSYYDWESCLGCRYFKACTCGCPGTGFVYTGNWTGRDVLQCTIWRMMEKYLFPVFPPKLKFYFEKDLNPRGFIPQGLI